MLAHRKFSAFRTVRLALILALIVAIFSHSFSGTGTTRPNDQRPALAAAEIELIPHLTMSTATAVEGWVKSRTGAAISGAVVTLYGQQATAGSDGYFSFTEAQLAPAVSGVKDKFSLIQVSVTAEGFAAWSISDVRYFPGDTLRLYPRLGPADEPATRLTAAARRSKNSGPSVSFKPVFIPLGSSPNRDASLAVAEASPLAAAPALPAQIRVYRTATQVVEVIPFKDYVKHVLPNEWISSWNRESLRAGAMAVKEYAWYWVALGGKQIALGADVKDNTEDQVYDPNVSYASTDAAVDATWQYSMTRNGSLFQANYCAGTYQADPTNDCPWNSIYMTQWGSSYHADQGRSWSWIVRFYYPNIVISPTPPGDGGPLPADTPSAPAPTSLPANTTYTVGQGAVSPALFQAAYERNGGAAVLGTPTGAVRWWMTYLSENNVLAQPFSGPVGGSTAWLVFDTLKSNVSGVSRVYALTGEIANAYSTHTPVGPEWVGAPTSDPYVANSGFITQGFTRGTLAFNGTAVQFTPWPQQVNGWEARYFPAKPPSTVQTGPTLDLPGQPASVLDVPSPNMDWASGSGVAVSLGVGSADWSVQFTRIVQSSPGSYDFVMTADSGVRLWIDGLLAINAWNVTGMHTENYNADFDAGPHKIRIQYFSPNGAARLDFSMTERGKVNNTANPPSGTGGTLPGAASVRVKVQWLGRSVSAGNSWVQPLSLSLSRPGNPAVVGTFSGTTDRNGVAIFTNLPVGVYDVHVKGDHSLQSARASITLAANRTAEVDMKAQIEGDVDGDNCVTVDDFSLVQAMVGSNRNTPGFNHDADLNGDGQVTVADISLLRSGFDMCGDISADAEYSALSSDGSPTRAEALAPWLNPDGLRKDLSLGLVASSSSVKVGQIIQVAVVATTNGQGIDGGSFLLNYDTSRLMPVDAAGNPAVVSEPGLSLPSVLTNWIDPKSGSIGYAAGMLQGTTPSSPVVLTTLKFRALKSGAAALNFASAASPYMQITNGGVNLLATATNVSLNVAP